MNTVEREEDFEYIGLTSTVFDFLNAVEHGIYLERGKRIPCSEKLNTVKRRVQTTNTVTGSQAAKTAFRVYHVQTSLALLKKHSL